MLILRQPFVKDFCDDDYCCSLLLPEASTPDAFNIEYPAIDAIDARSASQCSYMSQTFHHRLDQSHGTKQQVPSSTTGYRESSPQFVSSGVWPNQEYWRQAQGHDFATEQTLSTERLNPWWQMPLHQRALSNGSAQSYASTSPYTPNSPLPYASATSLTQNRHLSANKTSSDPSSPVQNLPTPTRTPTQESMLRSNPRRTTSSLRADGANTGQQAFRGSSAVQPPFLYRSSTRHGGGSGSTYSQDIPPTPKTVNGDDYDGPSNSSASYGEKLIDDDGWNYEHLFIDESVVTRYVPKFDRTMSDIYQDELYDPRNRPSMPSTIPNSTYNPYFLSPNQAMVNERLQQAHQARNDAPQIPRQVSPFRQSSDWANWTSDVSDNHNLMQTAAGLRERQKAENDAYVYRQHHPQPENAEPSTISPKDAFPMDNQVGEEEMPSLFPESSQRSGNGDSTAFRQTNPQSSTQFNFAVPTSFSFATPSLPASASNADQRNLPQYRPESSHSEVQESMPFPAALPSMETTRSDADDEPQEQLSSSPEEISKPSGTTASAGTYTCTYHGCTRRFESPPQLQKHKREDHRTTGTVTHDTDHSPSNAMTQAGPHRCTRKNPATGKPCNTVFSRPYDLTRHEDTIHAERKKVRCPHCTEEKLFSRADALTRHLRVVHPHVSFPTKHRKRAID